MLWVPWRAAARRWRLPAERLTVVSVAGQIPGVVSVRDLHVWALKPGMPLLATHLNIDGAQPQLAPVLPSDLDANTGSCSWGVACSTPSTCDSETPTGMHAKVLRAQCVAVAVDCDACEVLARATAYCRSKGISHTTIQLLHGQEACCIVSPRGHAV